MDAPASGCASDLSRRSYDPLSTDNAAASYRAIIYRGSPHSATFGPRGHRCRCRLFKRRDGLLPPVTSTVITLCVVFSTLVYVAATSSSPSHRDLARRSSGIAVAIPHRSEMETGSDTQIYIRGYDTRG